MQHLANLALVFVVSLAATVAVALLFRMIDKKPGLLNVVAIPVGITIAEAVRSVWSLSGVTFSFVVGAAVGITVCAAQAIGARRRT